jgi:hypothetical protein
MITRIQVRRGTFPEWVTENPVLEQGEIGYETDTQRYKIGNGLDNWNNLRYTGFEQEVLFWTYA